MQGASENAEFRNSCYTLLGKALSESVCIFLSSLPYHLPSRSRIYALKFAVRRASLLGGKL